MATDNLVQCYNRGCGQKYDPNNNAEDSCRHHPGEPVFHDAYKGWSCCNKKCTDFTEFLNISGCTLSKHSNIKPPEPEKPLMKDTPAGDIIEVKPIARETMQRPPITLPLILMQADIAPSLKQQNLSESTTTTTTAIEQSNVSIVFGTICKNGGCSTTYKGDDIDLGPCIYHPGQPVFHEGLKYWSCCTKRTSDFNAFISQVGCATGKHLWIKKNKVSEEIEARWDYHQTGTHVIVTIYAKHYCPDKSEIKLNPIRLYANLQFPSLSSSAAFNLDMELTGIVDVEKCKVNMYSTKVEIKLRKAEPGKWNRLDVVSTKKIEQQIGDNNDEKSLETRVESVDLSDL